MSRPVWLAVTLVVLLGATAASCGDEESEVALGTAARTTVAEVVDAPGAVTAKAAATVSAPSDGTLAALRVGPGDSVRTGQVLAIIDSPAAQQRLKQAKRALAAARRAGGGVGTGVNLSSVRRETDRAAATAFDAARDAASKVSDQHVRGTLLRQVDAAERHYDLAARAADQAIRAVQRGVAGLSSAVSALTAAQRLQAEQAYELAKATVDALTLRAPLPGVVQFGGTASSSSPLGGGASLPPDLSQAGGLAGALGGAAAEPAPGLDVAVPVGAPVTAGTPVLTVVDTSALGLVAEVDETDVLLVRPGQDATVELDAATGASYTGRVQSVDVLPTSSTRGGVAYRVRLALGGGDYPDGRPAPAPRPGMSAVVHLRVRQAEGAVAVPAAAIFSADGRDTIWVIRDGRAQRVTVTVGVQGQDLVQVVSGVDAGQRVVVRGTDLVEQGQELR
ncbi:efflux RND transporter periplasmic adaptor subunit [Actinomycetes bacterium KLBMP 9797]